MKKTLILLLALLIPAISQCEPIRKMHSNQDILKHPFFIIGMASGPMAYCLWKAYKGSKPAKIISKTMGTAALACAALFSAAIAAEEDLTQRPPSSAPFFMLGAATCGLATCVAANEVIEEIKDWNTAN